MEVQPHFEHITQLIEQAKRSTFQKVNTAIIELYCEIGSYLHLQTTTENWGKSVIKQLAIYLFSRHCRENYHGRTI